MRVIVDGENLRHQIAHVLYAHKKITHKSDYFPFDLVGFLRDALRQEEVQVSYYTTKIRQPKHKIPVALKKQLAAVSLANRKWVADLTNQGVRVEKAGYLRVRESSACVHCGKRTLVLQEKGVDVRVATELVQGKGEIVLVSSDSDLTPALEAAKTSGVKINYFCYAAWLNRSVAAQAYKTITYDDELVLKYLRGDS